MNKLTAAILVAGAAAAAGYIVSKVMKDKKNPCDSDAFDEEYCGSDCDCCDEELDVIIPAEETDDTAEDAVETEETSESSAEADEEMPEE